MVCDIALYHWVFPPAVELESSGYMIWNWAQSKLSRGLRAAMRSRSRCFCNSTWICASSRAPNTYEGPGSDFTARTAICIPLLRCVI